MSKSSGVRKNKTQITKSAVLERCRHTETKETVWSPGFRDVATGKASHLFASALSVNERSRSNVILVPPPGWLLLSHDAPKGQLRTFKFFAPAATLCFKSANSCFK